ncbi:MAG: hypothetical protein VW644_13835, partial [Alphaproteobacteria bacterium]
MEHRILLHDTVIAGELAERAFVLNMAALVEIALKHDFGVRRYQQVVGDAFDQRQGCAAQIGDESRFVHRQAHGRGDMIDRVRTEREADRKGFAAAHCGFVNRFAVARRIEVDAGLTTAPDHHPAAADIGQIRIGVEGKVEGRGQIRAAVPAMLKRDRQFQEVGVVSGPDNIVDRRLFGRNLDGSLRRAQPLHDLLQQVGFADAEGMRKALANANA